MFYQQLGLSITPTKHIERLCNKKTKSSITGHFVYLAVLSGTCYKRLMDTKATHLHCNFNQPAYIAPSCLLRNSDFSINYSISIDLSINHIRSSPVTINDQRFCFVLFCYRYLLLPVFRLLTGRFWDFSPRRSDTLHRSRSNLAGRSGP